MTLPIWFLLYRKIETLIDMGAYTLPVWWVVRHQRIELGK